MFPALRGLLDLGWKVEVVDNFTCHSEHTIALKVTTIELISLLWVTRTSLAIKMVHKDRLHLTV